MCNAVIFRYESTSVNVPGHHQNSWRKVWAAWPVLLELSKVKLVQGMSLDQIHLLKVKNQNVVGIHHVHSSWLSSRTSLKLCETPCDDL